MTMTMWRHSQSRRAPRSTRARFAVETLEERTVLSQVVHMPVAHHARHAEVARANAHSPMTITGLVVNDVALSGDQLIANATLSGTIKKHAFSLPVAIPITLTPAAASSGAGSAAPAATGATQVLNLSLGALNLSLLGLNVHLGSTCNFGDTAPITAQVVAIPSGSTYTFNGTTYQGGLLGSVLSDVANLLNSGSSLSTLATGGTVTGSVGNELNYLESNLTTLLNQVLGGLNSTNTAATGTRMAAPAGQHEVLDLDLNPITLDLLGAFVHTSNICLNITATKGPGNLLGNLL